jgi:hypothetical protein
MRAGRNVVGMSVPTFQIERGRQLRRPCSRRADRPRLLVCTGEPALLLRRREGAPTGAVCGTSAASVEGGDHLEPICLGPESTKQAESRLVNLLGILRNLGSGGR